MQHIKVYDKPENWEQEGMTPNCMVLGVHSFSHILTDLAEKKNIKILLKGKAQQITQNILWNEYYSYTLLKDIDRIIFENAQQKNIFIKIGGKTYRFIECLDWEKGKKIQQDVRKYFRFSIEGFMMDSSIKFIQIDIDQCLGQRQNRQSYDIIFQYFSQGDKVFINSFSGYENKSHTHFEAYKRPQTINENHQAPTIPTKIVVENSMNSLTSYGKTKYLTEKKQNKQNKETFSSSNFNRNSINPQANTNKKKGNGQPQKSSRKSKRNISIKNDREKIAQSVKSEVYAGNGRYQIDIERQANTKESIVSTLLQKKEQKIIGYKEQLLNKEKQHEQVLIKMQKVHQNQVEVVKRQVQEVLQQYRKKNKALKKENDCLSELNQQLTLANKRLNLSLEQMTQKIDKLSQKQQKLEKDSTQSALKLQKLEQDNERLSEQLKKQQFSYRSELAQKEKNVNQLKTKYERLVSNIRFATFQIGKQNQL